MRFLLLLVTIAVIHSAEVDTLNMLLPELAHSAFDLPKQLLTTKGGCYDWSSSSPQTLKVTPRDPTPAGCSRQALVEVAQPGPFPSSIYVTASDAATESLINIPSRIRKVHSIFIATKSRMMDIREMQKLELYAHDSEENTFTSLQGLRFRWTLVQNQKILQTVPISQAKLLLPLKTRQDIEKKGFQSDILVVRALAPGNLKVIAKCIEPGEEHLSNQIVISVHQRFQLAPGPVLLMAPSSSIQLNLQRPSEQKIAVPQSYYHIVTCPGFNLTPQLFLTVPSSPSQCLIKVEDTRTKPPYSSSVTVIVEGPDSIKIGSEETVIVGKKSSFKVSLFSKGRQLLGMPSSLETVSSFVIDKDKQLITAQKKAIGFISATFGPLTAKNTVISYLPIKVLLPDNSLHLPVGETFRLRALGGSGVYDYHIESQVAHVSSGGVIACDEEGQTDLTVMDRGNHANKAVIRLKISSIARIFSLERQIEVNREEWGGVYVLATNKQGNYFTQCLSSSFTFKAQLGKFEIEKNTNFTRYISRLAQDKSRIVQDAISPTSLLKNRLENILNQHQQYLSNYEISSEELKKHFITLQNYGICEFIRFRSLTALEETSTILLAGSVIEDRVPLRVYQHLQTTISEDRTTFIMTPQSSLSWSHSGGSQPWPQSQTTATINGRISQFKKQVLTCDSRESGETAYELMLSNKQTKKLLFPTSQRSTITVICKYPRRLQLESDEGQAYESLLIHPNANVKGTVRALDEFGVPFYNASNVVFVYSSDRGSISGHDRQFEYTATGQSDTIRIYCDKLASGKRFNLVELKIDLSITEPLAFRHLLFNESERLQPVNMKKYVRHVVLFDPSSPYILHLINASPLLMVKCLEAVSCDKHQNEISVNLLRVGRGRVIVRDRRVYGSTEWTFEFIIVEPDQLRLFPSSHYIQNEELVNVTVYNMFQGQKISPALYRENHLHLILPTHLQITKQYGNVFTVKALQPGTYSIFAEQDFPKHIKSKEENINVYDRIKIDLANMIEKKMADVLIIQGVTTLVTGCKRVLYIGGGPTTMAIAVQTEKYLTSTEKATRNYQISSQYEGQYQATFTITNHNNLMAIIKAKVVVSSVKSLSLFSISQPRVGAVFRILPRFRIGQLEVDNCLCDFEYEWKTLYNLVSIGSPVTFGYLAGGGVNATALSPGSETITLVVKDRKTSYRIIQSQLLLTIILDCSTLLPSGVCGKTSNSQSFLIAPHSGYSFSSDADVSVIGDVVRLGMDKRKIQSGHRNGEAALRIARNGCLDQVVAVQVTPISGAIINNQYGFLALVPHSQSKVAFDLMDKHGRVFASPLSNIEITVTSSNPEVLTSRVVPNQNTISLHTFKSGTCLLTIFIGGSHVYDEIVVSVGSQIRPTFEAAVLEGGQIRYSLPSSQQPHWIVGNSTVATIDKHSGLLHALNPGRTKVASKEVFGWVNVKSVKRVEMVGQSGTGNGGVEATFKAIWDGVDREEEIPSSPYQGIIKNTIKLRCDPEQPILFDVISTTVSIGQQQKLRCKVVRKPSQLPKPEEMRLSVKDKDGHKLGTFTLSLNQGFTFSPAARVIQLSKSNPTATLSISSRGKVGVTHRGGKGEWISQTHDPNRKLQLVAIDMNGHSQSVSWQLSMSLGQQRQVVRVMYSPSDSSGGGQSFFSFSFDWSDILLGLMALVFASIFVLQYFSQNKIKYA